MKGNVEGAYGEFAKADAVRQVLTMKQTKKEYRNEQTPKEEKNQQLEAAEAEITRLQEIHQAELQQREAQLEQYVNTIQRLSALVREKDEEILLKESQLQQKDQELQQINADMNRLQRRLLRLQTEPKVIEIPLKLKWRKMKDLPFTMWYYPQSVAVGERVFMGGGRASSPLEREILMIYHVQLDKWDTLPCGVMWSALAVWKNQLLLVSGRDVRTNKRIKTLKVLDETQDSQGWSFPFPSMPDARDGATAIVHDDRWVVVVGGYCDVEDSEVPRVEILDASLKQWHTSAPLPQPCGLISAAVVGNMLMLLGGFSGHRSSCRVLSADLDDLISFHSHSTCTAMQPPWKPIPIAPSSFSTALSLKGALLAVGGREVTQHCEMKSIHLYQPHTKSWIKVGELPTERWQCACTVLPTGELFIAGNGDMVQKQVDLAIMI